MGHQMARRTGSQQGAGDAQSKEAACCCQHDSTVHPPCSWLRIVLHREVGAGCRAHAGANHPALHAVLGALGDWLLLLLGLLLFRLWCDWFYSRAAASAATLRDWLYSRAAASAAALHVAGLAAWLLLLHTGASKPAGG